MKKYPACIIIIIILLNLPLFGKTAVVKAAYDRIDSVLRAYRIPFETLSLEDLEDPNKLTSYDSIYFPCGIDIPPDKNINILARGRSIQSVSLKKDSRDSNMTKIADNIRVFVKNGGSAYFSCYTFKYVQKAFNPFTFFDDFPYMGMEGRVAAEPRNDLYLFSLEETHALYMSHPGWIAIKEAKNSQPIAYGHFDTPRGEREGPLTVIMKRGQGEILYTSHHSTLFSDFRRFNIYRTAGNIILKNTLKKAAPWEQEITGEIVDALHSHENTRTYRLLLRKGNNTIFFNGENNPFQTDIMDSGNSLIMSIKDNSTDRTIDLMSGKEEKVYIKVYPLGDKRYNQYCIITASGRRFFPYWYTTLLILIGLSSVAVFIFLLITSDRNKYAGRLR